MTYKELVATAHREMGESEESIAQSAKMASFDIPGAPVDEDLSLSPADERRMIEAIKQQYREIQAMTTEERERLLDSVFARQRRRSKSN